MYSRVMRELTLKRESMAKPNFVMFLEDVSNYIRKDYLNSVDENTAYTSLKFGIAGTELKIRKVSSPKGGFSLK